MTPELSKVIERVEAACDEWNPLAGWPGSSNGERADNMCADLQVLVSVARTSSALAEACRPYAREFNSAITKALSAHDQAQKETT